MQKNPGFDKDKTDVMFGLTLYDFASFIFLYVKGIKFLLKIKLWASFTKAWSPCVILFFLFSLFISLFFFQDDSLEHRSFIGFLCKPRKIKPLSLLFILSPLFSYCLTPDYQVSIHYKTHVISLSLMPSFLRVP